jgi:UPF0716 protein FxsA
MFAVLALVFIVLPLVEIYVAIQVGHVIGAWNTIGLLLVFSLCGAWLAKRQGFAVIERMRRRLEQNELPGKEIIDGVLVFAAGILMVIPGFVTDAFGLLLLLPPVRTLVRKRLTRRFTVTTIDIPQRRPPGPDGYGSGPGVIDV